jgi:hypothetical protein
MPEYTQGPWKMCGAREGKCVCGGVWSIPLDMPILRIVPTHDGVADAPARAWSDEDYANMRLAVAGWEMLQALKLVMSDVTVDERIQRVVSEAIRAAEGR